MTRHPQLIFWLVILLAPFFLLLLAWLALRRRLGELYSRHFENPRRERLFLSAISFLVTFSAARTVASAVHREAIDFRGVFIGTTHVHHLVFGILILLLVGYLWLIQIGTGIEKPLIISPKSRRWLSRITAVLYGIGSALTLDEFALWFNLANVYWEREGRKSIDAVILFLTILSISLWGGAFFRSLFRLLFRGLKVRYRH
ncbi:MAG: hypothetical protein JMDDDDMK_01816 [Acidobacteria bacterium]|nr:hypothetical protein [Acidobacteriota bacterium]